MKQWLIYPLVATVATALLYLCAHIGIGWSALLAFLGWPLVGTLVTSDEDLPGGWNNPDGKATPDWETTEYWGKLFGGSAVVCVAFFVQLWLGAAWSVWFIPAAVFSALASFLLLRRACRASHHAG